jgi:hypothetical protein
VNLIKVLSLSIKWKHSFGMWKVIPNHYFYWIWLFVQLHLSSAIYDSNLILTNVISSHIFFPFLCLFHRPWPYTTLERGYDLVTGEQAPEKILRWVDSLSEAWWWGIDKCPVGRCVHASLEYWFCVPLSCIEHKRTLMGTNSPSWPRLLWESNSYLSGI